MPAKSIRDHGKNRKPADPIRSRAKIQEIKDLLKAEGRLGDYCTLFNRHQYLAEHPSNGGHPAANDPDAPLFPSRKHPSGKLTPVSRYQVHKIIKGACEAVGLENGNWSTHSLRKSLGYHWYKDWVSLELIQKKLGHRDRAVTLDYIGITDDNVSETSNKINL